MSRRTRVDQVERLIGRLFGAVDVLQSHFEQCASQLDLTPQQARLLINSGSPCSQRDLAQQFSCDASNIVGIVDRLEQRGLVARQPSTHDRRVKQVVLTADGEALRDRFRATLTADMPGVSSLSSAQLDELELLLAHFTDVPVLG
jgi:DNA-binding MarR family transcriptional regulator